MFKRVSDRFSDRFSRFSNRYSDRFKSFSGAVSFCRHAALICFSGMAGYCAIPSPLPPKICPIAAEGRGVAGGIATQAALWRVSRYTGVPPR